METTPHYFGGLWTELKLEAISAYSKFFTGALKAQNFDLWYIDPFAGTGSREEVRVTGGLLTGEPAETKEVSYPGSAARSLMVKPPFHHFVFGDERRSRRAALAKLKAQYPERDIRIVPGDANDALQELFSQPPLMRGSMARGSARAFVFLDPYGMSVRWATLAKLAASQRADVWFLVNLKAAIQQLCRDHSALDEHKRAALYEYFGTHEWEKEFYSTAVKVSFFQQIQMSEDFATWIAPLLPRTIASALKACSLTFPILCLCQLAPWMTIFCCIVSATIPGRKPAY